MKPSIEHGQGATMIVCRPHGLQSGNPVSRSGSVARRTPSIRNRFMLAGLIATTVVIAACSRPPEEQSPAPDRAPDIFDLALASSERPAADRERDTASRPAEVLRFFNPPREGVVVDLFAGGGYYSEILSRILGDHGTVYLHNNQAYLDFAGDAVEERLAGNRLPNVIRYDRELDAIDLADDSVDMILMVMTYHDLYFKTDEWDLDPDTFFATVHRMLKPGGILAIVDHAALPDTGSTAAQELHRIDPAFAREDIEGHGFEFIAESDLLLNPEDSLEIGVFDPSIRGRTSKFLYKFVEPAG